MYTLPDSSQFDWPPAPTHRPIRRRNFWVELLKFLGLFVFFFALLAGVVMGPTIYTKVSYLWTAPTNNYSQKYNLPVAVSDSASDIKDITTTFDQLSTSYAQDTIVIPKINVDAPIVYLDTTDNATIIKDIQSGVGHYLGTAFPGQLGNAFFTGHSSYYWWSHGKYNQVFALLDHLVPGDLIYMYYKGDRFVYRVSQNFVVKPSQVDVMAPTSQPILTLMTCTPVGTNLNRLIVQADLIGRPPVTSGNMTGLTGLPVPPTILPLY